MTYDEAKAEGRSPTQAERAAHWRKIANEESAKHEAEFQTSTEDLLRMITAILRAVRHSIRTPEMASIVGWAERFETTLAEVLRLYDAGENGVEATPDFIRAMDELRKFSV